MDTEKQRQRRRDDARLTESGNARSEQLNTRGAYRVTNQQSLACLSGSGHRRPGCNYNYWKLCGSSWMPVLYLAGSVTSRWAFLAYDSGGTTSHAQSSESCETKCGVGLGLFSRLHFYRALSLVTRGTGEKAMWWGQLVHVCLCLMCLRTRPAQLTCSSTPHTLGGSREWCSPAPLPPHSSTLAATMEHYGVLTWKEVSLMR